MTGDRAGTGRLVWKRPALNALAFGIFVATVALADALWMNRGGDFYSDEIGRRGYEIAAITRYYFFRFGFFSAIVFLVEVPLHTLTQRLFARLAPTWLSATLLLPLFDACVLGGAATLVQVNPLEAFYLIFAPLLGIETAIFFLGRALPRLSPRFSRQNKKKPRAGSRRGASLDG